MSVRLSLVAVAALLCGATSGARAQEPSAPAAGPAPANLAYVEGGVEVTHEGLRERAEPPVMLEDGDIIRTPSGRAEIVFGDGTLLHLDYNAEIELLSPDRLRLLRGRALFRVTAAATHEYEVDTPAASLRLSPRGEYDIVADDVRVELDLSVARGIADVSDGNGQLVVRAGERMLIAGPGTRPMLQSFNAAQFDAFERWSNDRSNGFAAAPSATHLPSELRPYGPELDQSGRWDYNDSYGYVWYPSVGVAWRPYYHGAWGYTRHGWTWHGYDRWAWPTHHYGRWGYNGAFWFWIPGKVWSPAWVVWGGAPGYVSWAPHGWTTPWVGYGYPAYRPYDHWRGWTVVPQRHFGYRRAMSAHAIDGGRLDTAIQRSWSVQTLPPAMPLDYAVPRSRATGTQVIGPATVVPPGGERRGNVRRPSAGDAANPYQGNERDRSTRIPGVVRDQRARESEAPVVRSAPPPSARGRDGSQQGDSDRQPSERGGSVTGQRSDRGDRGDSGSVDRAVPRSQPRGESARSGSASGSDGGSRARGGSSGSARGQGGSQGGSVSGGAARRSPPR